MNLGGRHSVFVLEDEEANRHTIHDLIAGRADLTLVFSARDGEEALQFLHGALPEIAFIDINVPLKSGIRVAEAAATLGCTVIFTTALTDYALRAYRLGAADYLVKPVDKVHFDTAVDRALALRAGGRPREAAEDRLQTILRDQYYLTPTERELCELILTGCPRELLEERTGKTARTIKSHLQSVYHKTINTDPRSRNEGRGDKYGRLVYFLFALRERIG